MSDKKNNMAVAAMNYAIPLGLFWIFKYLFVILGEYSELSKYIWNFLSIGTPILFYIILCQYRDKDREGKIDFGDCILFSLLLFLFASILESVIVALHVYIISPEYVAQMTELTRLNSMNSITFTSTEQREMYDKIVNGILTNIRPIIIVSKIIGDLFLGLFLSLILGYFVSKQSPNQPKSM